ncbi:copper chaperone PCu(A)C [Rhizobiaceae sp. 2RAB30]
MVLKLAAFSAMMLVTASTTAGAANDRHAPPSAGLSVEHADIVLSPSGWKMSAGYLVVWNGTQNQVDLAAVESGEFGSVSLHRTETSDGVMRMRPVKGVLPIPGHSELLMKQGGIHLMLSGQKAPLKPDDTVDLELRFQDGTRVTAAARVLASGTPLTDHHHGQGDEAGH